MQIRSKFAVSVVSLLGVLACGDDDSGGGGGGSGVASSKKVGDLSESEARALCRQIEGKFARIGAAQTELVCVAQAAALSGGDAARCESSADQCRMQDAEALALDCDGEDGETGGVSTECDDVTVGELNDCIEASAKALEAISKMVTCETDVSELGDLSTSYETPASCTSIEAKCPDVAVMGTP
jgi:hypothetical protein